MFYTIFSPSLYVLENMQFILNYYINWKNWRYANALKPFDFDVDSDPESVMGSDKIINKNLNHDFVSFQLN